MAVVTAATYQYPLNQHIQFTLQLLVFFAELLCIRHQYASKAISPLLRRSRGHNVPPVVSTFLSLPSVFVSSFFSASPLTALALPLSAAVGFFSSSFAMMITK